MPSRCKICSLGYAEQRRVDRALLAGDTIQAVSAKFGGLPTASLTRHRLNHLDRSVRAPERIDEDRSAADVLIGMADRLMDLDRVTNDALQHGRSSVAVKATTEARAISKILFSDLGLDSTGTALWLRDLETAWQGMRRVMRQKPDVALLLADAVQDTDARMAKEMRAAHDLLITPTTVKEHAA
ncbi:hypothetical protein [Amnibacterium kyonggiense]|uniref:Uncharacterized protein n=1 Tax=Amnibacterium kyonggiense TaxID=595671 RepID=A0A4R7FIU7_9MICO|nr:hypothetical protein [Amnibacterium kyonggiense]TDS74802.1 hypothetical protein CLV52_3323 [Amnibacterium kyonggiense]